MERLVRKRDGNIVPYNKDKIAIAIQKAGKASDSPKVLEVADELAKNVEFILEKEFFRRGSVPSVEEIQDVVEKVLIKNDFVETAKAYILYREKRRELREFDLTKESALLLVDEYLQKTDWRVNENSNMTYSLQGLNFNVSSSLVARYWLSKIYPEEIRIANDSGLFHIHDLGVLGPYTYFGKEVIVAKIKDRIKLISFEKLYDCINSKEETLDIKEEVTVKSPKDLFVLDKDGWTEVKRVVKKKKNRPMHFIKNRGGRSVIVTDNHPMITEDCEKEAKDVVTQIDKTFSVDIERLLPEEELFKTVEIDLLRELMNEDAVEAYFNGIPIKDVSPFDNSDGIIHTQSFSSRRKIKLSQKFGYFVGFALAEGYLSYDEANSRTITISQKFKEPLLKANEGLIENGMSGCLRKSGEKYELRVRNPFLRLLFEQIFKIEPGSRNKTLPEEILYYGKDFVMGLLAGLTDGDGSIATCNTVINIRIAGRTLLEQSAIVLSLLGFTPRDRCIEGQNTIHSFNGKLIIQNYPLYGVSFRKIEKDIPSEKYNNASVSVCAWHDESKDEWHKVINNELTDIPDNYIYDITTESGTLVVNGMWNHNCVGWSLEDLLYRGFGGVRGKIESAPPKHFRTALGQVVNFFYTLQGEAAGAQAFSNFDTLLAPFVRFDKLSYPEVKQAMQEFIFNLNVPTRVGFQTPFTNLTFDLVPPNQFKNKFVIYAGNKLDVTYGEFEKEMSMINQAFAELMMEGDRKGRIFTFPIPTYNITKDFDWERENLDKIWEMTAKYGVPYFANFVNSDMSPDDARSMCLHPDEEVLITNSGNIKRLSIGELVDKYKDGDFDTEGWAVCNENKNLKMLSLNPKTLALEWTKVVNFLKVADNYLVKIETEDGKFTRLSRKHLIPIITEDGLKVKRAEEICEGDYLLCLKKAVSCLSKNYQKLSDDLILDEDLAKILGYFIADGNYLFKNHKNSETLSVLRGLQFTFNCKDEENINIIKDLLEKRLGYKAKCKKDPRYNTFYLYVYNSSLARAIYKAGFKKYGRLPQILFNSPKEVIEAFLTFHFKGDGYEKRKEIHINDIELSRDLLILYSLLGMPATYRRKKNSQVIYLAHNKGKLKSNNLVNSPLISELVPGFMAYSTYRVPGLIKSRMVGLQTLSKYEAHTEESIKFANSDVYITRVKSVSTKELEKPQIFYDVELENNHLFVHSLGTISHNCCRLRLDKRELKKRGGGLFGADPLTGSVGVVTINIPRIAYISRNDEEFFLNLENAMELAKTSLEIKRKVIENFTERGLYPYSRYYLNNVKKDLEGYWANHFSTIGLIGMNEAALNFLGKPIGDPEARNWVINVIIFMRDKIRDFQEETGNLYNLEATPAEGASYRLAKKDKEQFDNIITSGDNEVPYYTNSVHLPVYEEHDIFEVLEHQDDLQSLFTGGTVVHLFLGEAINDFRMCRELVKKIVYNYKLPYFTLTPTFSICPVHGYLKGEHSFCPNSHTEAELHIYGIREDSKIIIKPEIYSRIVGYFRPVENWNRGKKKEFSQRANLKVVV